MENRVENFLLFQSEDVNYVIDITEVREIVDSLDVFPFPIQHLGHLGVANCRGDVIDVISLAESIKRKNLNLKMKTRIQKAGKTLIISQDGKGTIGIPCESIRKIELPSRPSRPNELVNCGNVPAAFISASWLFELLEVA